MVYFMSAAGWHCFDLITMATDNGSFYLLILSTIETKVGVCTQGDVSSFIWRGGSRKRGSVFTILMTPTLKMPENF